MGITTANGNYIKIKSGTISGDGLEYYTFRDKATREAMSEEDLAKMKSKKLNIVINMNSVVQTQGQSIDDALKVVAYSTMKAAIVPQATIINTTPFSGATDN